MVHTEKRSTSARSKTHKFSPGIITITIQAFSARVVEGEGCVDRVPRRDSLLSIVFEDVIVFAQLEFAAFVFGQEGEDTGCRFGVIGAKELAVDDGMRIA